MIGSKGGGATRCVHGDWRSKVQIKNPPLGRLRRRDIWSNVAGLRKPWHSTKFSTRNGSHRRAYYETVPRTEARTTVGWNIFVINFHANFCLCPNQNRLQLPNKLWIQISKALFVNLKFSRCFCLETQVATINQVADERFLVFHGNNIWKFNRSKLRENKRIKKSILIKFGWNDSHKSRLGTVVQTLFN